MVRAGRRRWLKKRTGHRVTAPFAPFSLQIIRFLVYFYGTAVLFAY